MYSFFNTIITFFFLVIIRDSNVFSNCSVKIEVFSIAFLASTLSPARVIDRFFAVFSASAKSLF
jgi:hypothetical protein